jgi:hypothetical protein
MQRMGLVPAAHHQIWLSRLGLFRLDNKKGLPVKSIRAVETRT